MDEDDIIHRYTREQAIEDGVLVDVTHQAKEKGFKVQTCITAALHEKLENIPVESVGQDYIGRLHDVLWMTFLKARANPEQDFIEVEVIIDGEVNKLFARIDCEGLTIMFPEDY